MKKLTIAIDVDDVLAMHYEALVDFYNSTYDADLRLEDYTTDHWSNVWGLDEAETRKRAEAFADSGLHLDFLLKRGAQEAVKKLREHYTLVIVTARRQQNVKPTLIWLTKHFPDVFAETRFLPIWETDTKQTKADICKELGADVLVDDSIKHCGIAASEGMKAVLFGDYPWNRAEQLPDGVTRCDDWPAVVEYFTQMEKHE